MNLLVSASPTKQNFSPSQMKISLFNSFIIANMARRRRSFTDCCSRILVKKQRERRNSECSGSLSHVLGIKGLRKAILGKVLARLCENGVTTIGLASMLFDHCLPTTTLNRQFWEILLHNPLKLSDRMLVDILGLQTARPSISHEELPQQTTIYIRTFHLEVGQLRDIALHFRNNGLGYPKITTWLESTQSMQPEEIIHIRYVGRTTRDALRRHREDLLTRRSGFMAKFLTCLEKLCPTVIDSVSLHTFPPIQIQGAREVVLFNEISEQAVIALLGPRFLLNQTCTSAAAWDFQPSENHRREFQALRTNTISRLSPARFHLDFCQQSIEAWANDLQDYAREHQHSVSHFRNKTHEFTDALRDMIIRQSTPSVLDESIVLFLTVGAGISHQAYREQESFYKGPSDSAKLMRLFLNRIWNWERPECRAHDYVEDLVSAGALPFVDLCPWQKATGRDLEAAAEFLKRYIHLTKPHIILTIAECPSSIIASANLHSDDSHVLGSFWSRVGELELIQLEGHCCIQIPCFHPGQGRFSVNPSVFLNVFDRTLWILLLTISVSLDSIHLATPRSRENWCRYVKRTVDNTLHGNGFRSKFSILKTELHKQRPKSTATALSSKERSKIAIATRKDVVCLYEYLSPCWPFRVLTNEYFPYLGLFHFQWIGCGQSNVRKTETTGLSTMGAKYSGATLTHRPRQLSKVVFVGELPR